MPCAGRAQTSAERSSRRRRSSLRSALRSSSSGRCSTVSMVSANLFAHSGVLGVVMTGSVFLERRCANARALGSAALDGGLSAFEQRLLDDHLDTCPDCAAVVAEMGRVTALVRATPVEAPTVLAAPARPAKGRRLGWAARASIAVASLAVAAGLGLMAGASR